MSYQFLLNSKTLNYRDLILVTVLLLFLGPQAILPQPHIRYQVSGIRYHDTRTSSNRMALEDYDVPLFIN